MARKNSPSSAMAKKMRGAVRIDPTSVLNVASITTTVTAPTPIRPSTACAASAATRSEEHTSELQSQSNLVCRLLLEKKKSGSATHDGFASKSTLMWRDGHRQEVG